MEKSNRIRRIPDEPWKDYMDRMKAQRHDYLARFEKGDSMVEMSKELGISWFTLQRKIAKARRERETAQTTTS